MNEGLRACSTGNTNPAVYTGLHSLYRAYLENKVTNVPLFPGVVVLLVEVTVYFSLLRGAVSQPKTTPFVLAQWKLVVE